MRRIVRWVRPWGAYACVVVRDAVDDAAAEAAARRTGHVEADATRVVVEPAPWGDEEPIVGAEEVAA